MPTYENWAANPYQYSMEDYTTSTTEGDKQAISYSPGYLQELMELRKRVRNGTASAWDRENYKMQMQAAMTVPMRDAATLRFNAGEQDATSLSGGSPDLARIMMMVADKMEKGQATAQERALFTTTYKMLADQNFRASVPQESDKNPFGMGNNLTDALMMLATGVSGGTAAAALAGGGLSLAALSGLAGVTSGITNMLAEPLDSKALRLAGLATGAAAGATSLASLLSNGLNSVGDVVKAVQKVYGTGTKAMSLINAVKQAGDNPAVLAQAQQAQREGRQVGANSQQLSSADQRTDGRASTTEGGGMATMLDSLGPLLAGVVGAVGTGIQLKDVERYMDQLKVKYGQQEETKQLIDDAYKLAVARYETYYAQTQEERTQKQDAYKTALERYETRYDQQQQQFEKQQAQSEKIEGQVDRDRNAQVEAFYHNREKVDESYNRQVQEAKEERDYQVSRDSANVAKYDASYQKRVAEADQYRAKQYQHFDQQQAKFETREAQRDAQVAQDRDKQYSNYDTQFDLAQKNQALREAQTAENRAFERGAYEEERGQYRKGYERQVAQSEQERGLDLTAYQQRQQIGKNLSDPAALKAGAEALYQPLSALARDRINVQSEEEMARRGVSGGGMYSNLLAAKAFAPQEQQLWTNALNAYLTGQNSAVNAYTQQDMTMSPEYRTDRAPTLSTAPGYDWRQLPQFSKSEEYRITQMPQFTESPVYNAITAPDLQGGPTYNPYNIPTWTRSSMDTVPGAPGYEQAPGVPETRKVEGAPTVPGSTHQPYYADPYEPWGTSAKTGGGPGGPLAGAGNIMEKLTQVLGDKGLAQQIMKLFSSGGGDAFKAFTAWGGDERNQPWYDPAYLEDSPWNWQGVESDYSNWDPWAGIDYNPTAGSDVDYW